MNDFGVLTNRKRALIALIHSVVFLGVAFHGFLAPKAGILHETGATGDLALIVIYLIVSSILLWLVSMSRGLVEKLYFGLCTVSASAGLFRTIFGDQVLPSAQYLRVLMLTSAVGVGFLILRAHARASIPATSLPSEAVQD